MDPSPPSHGERTLGSGLGKRKRPRRAARPCDACRRRKTRCVLDAGASACVYCLSRSTACTFEESPPERMVLEKERIGNVASEVEQGFPATYPAPAMAQRVGSVTSPSVGASVIRGGASATTSGAQGARRESALQGHTPIEILDEGARSTSFATPMQDDGESHTVAGEKTLGMAGRRFAELYGLTSDMEPILMRHRPYDPITHEFRLDTHAIRQVLKRDNGQEYPVTFHTVSDERAIGHSTSFQEVDSIENCVRPYGPRLVGLFWRIIQPSYPILYKEGFVEKYSASYRCISAPLLGAVYLNALSWWAYDPELSIRAPPDSTALRKLTLQAIQNSYHRPRLSSIEAILLLLQCKPEDPLNPDHTFAGGLTFQALAIGQSIGLHLDASEWSIPRWERNLRKRLGWALYMQDKWTATAYGRPTHIHDDDWVLQDLVDGDFSDCQTDGALPDESSAGAAGKAQFIQMVKLAKILSLVLARFYTVKASQNQDTSELFHMAQPILQMLHQWYQELPPNLSMHVRYQRQLSPHGFLHFSYHGVMVTLVRRLIRSTALPPSCLDHTILADTRQIALQTAQEAMAFVSSLRPDHLEAFWYFTSPYLFSVLGSFTTLLLVTSLSTQERNYWQDTLNSYLWTLRTMSKGSEPMRYAANRLEGAILRGLEHALAVNLQDVDHRQSPVVAPQPPVEGLEFADFGHWDLAAIDLGAFDLLSNMDVRDFTGQQRP